MIAMMHQDQATDDQRDAEDEAVEHDRRADRREERPRAGAGHVHARRRLGWLGSSMAGAAAAPNAPGRPAATVAGTSATAA